MWENIVRRNIVRRKIVVALLSGEGMMRRRMGCDNGRMCWGRNGRSNVKRMEGWEGFDGRRKKGRRRRRKEGWEGFAHRFNIAAGFSPEKQGNF